LYPTQKQVNAEFETKWKQFLPRNGYEFDSEFGWEVEKDSKKNIIAIHFRSGVHVYFKTYSQNENALQSGTVDALFCDEELPFELYSELMFRISASSGYFHMVFTATLGQEEWRRAMEPKDADDEFLPGAFKKTVSLYDAMHYEDGTASHWTAEKIAEVRARCSTQQEIDKRVYGRFVVLGGRKCEAFDIKRHMRAHHPIPRSWLIYGGADPGSGGDAGHPAAICFVAVRPDYRAGRVFMGWRGDGITTTSGDVVDKYIEMKKSKNLFCTGQYYDWADKDFWVIADRKGEHFEKAEKGHEAGEEILNTLFKNDMLLIYDDSELGKLGGEISSLLRSTPKNKAKDDFYDALRYTVTKIPWDFSFVGGELADQPESPQEVLTPMQIEVRERRQRFMEGESSGDDEIDAEIDAFNEDCGE
jgi:phage terminase large subunit-like protein